MLKKSAFSTLTLLSLTCLTSFVHAMEEPVSSRSHFRPSDIANGNIPEEMKGKNFNAHQKEVVKQVQVRINDYERTRSQLVSYFGATVISDADGDNRENVREIANTICMFLAKQAEKNKDKRMLIEGQSEQGKDTIQSRKDMNGRQYGIHAALVAEGKQKEADEYALIRYFAYKNMYDAIPNPDDGEFKEESLISALNPGQEALVEKMIQKAVTKAATQAMQAWINKNLNLRIAAAYQFENAETLHRVQENYCLVHKQLVSQGEYTNVRTWINANSERSSTISAVYPACTRVGTPEQVKDAHTYVSIPTFEEICKSEDGQMDYRPHAFLKRQADKWLAKIDPATSSLVKELALDAALFNPNLEPEGHRQLSFVFEGPEDVSTANSGSTDTSESKNFETKLQEVNTLIDQLNLKFGSIVMRGKVPDLKKRLRSISGFLEGKQANILAKKEADEKATDKKEDKNISQAAAHAFVKYVSYTQLQFALTHDADGNVIPIFASVRPASSTSSLSALLSRSQFGLSGLFTQSFVNMTYCLDDFFHQKAQKWGKRVVMSEGTFIKQQCGKHVVTTEGTFIKDNALNASLFR